MQDVKKNIKSKINDIDKMLNELSLSEFENDEQKISDRNIDINNLDVVDVLHNILN